MTLHYYINWLNKLEQKNLKRKLENISGDFLDFTHNDYLCLSRHPAVIEAGIKAAQKYGAGGTASRLVLKTHSIYDELEQKIAQNKRTESALIFSSGYQTNASVISALLDKKVLGLDPLVFSDRLNHASIHHGCNLARIKQIRYRNCDLAHLKSLLEPYHSSSQAKFILSETVFSMDGSVVNIEQLVKLATKHNAFLYLDEAHSTGLFGETGYGLSSAFAPHIDLVMGTFSKAIGVSGGYIACTKSLKDYLINKAGGIIYSTAPSPFTIGSIQKAWELIPTLDLERQNLFMTAHHLKRELQALGYDTDHSQSHIIPLIIGDEHQVISLQNFMRKHRILVSAIRPPTVPIGTARLRLSLNINHTAQHIEQFLSVLQGWQRSRAA